MLALPVLLAASLSGSCASFVEVPVETPLQAKIDVSELPARAGGRLRLRAGRRRDMDLGSETTRLLQNQLRSNTKLQVLEPDRPPLHDALEKILEKLGEGGRYTQAGAASSTSWRPTARCRTPSTGARWARSTRTR